MNRHCSQCREPVTDQPWILLNRFGFGTGINRCYVSCLNEDEVYMWEPGKNAISGHVIHIACLSLWIECEMADVDLSVDLDQAPPEP